jgi:inosine-uridine nucleoside N-ribohydrolase
MGGAHARGGNQTPAAEFNIYADPEAAAIVVEAGWPVTMVGLDLTHQAGVPAAIVSEIRAMGTRLSDMVVNLLESFRAAYSKVGTLPDPPLHDPCAVARVARPSLVAVQDAFVAVETRGEWTTGMTVSDFRGKLGRPPNAKVATRLDVDGFWDLMIAALAAVGARSLVKVELARGCA